MYDRIKSKAIREYARENEWAVGTHKDGHVMVKSPCPRCGGSGHYSYCQMYGTVCFECEGRTYTWETIERRYRREQRQARKARKVAAEAKALEGLSLITEREVVQATLEREKARRKADRQARQRWLGTPGERVEVELTRDFCRAFDGYYGTRWLWKGHDASGNAVLWWTSSVNCLPDDGEDCVTVRGTVKAHDKYRGSKQTVLSRVKILKKTHSSPCEL